jgi:Prolyl oligopeptidase family
MSKRFSSLRVFVLEVAALVVLCGTSNAEVPVRELKGMARAGQIFLTWKEARTSDGTTFNVYLSERPITKVEQAECVAHHIEAHSARDWWEDDASFKKGASVAKPVGWRIESQAERLDPDGGLFVHTVRKKSDGKTLYFAVTHSDEQGNEDTSIVLGDNSLSNAIVAESNPIQPIWQHDAQPIAVGAGKGKGLSLTLHGKGGIVADSEYLFFGDETMGWREGLPFKFSTRIEGDTVILRPTDRVWINRPHNEANDGGTNAIWTFWYGYNSNIYDRRLMANGSPTNYTERRLLWMIEWVSRYFQPDANRFYCSGSSMGGCGTISFGLRHPELFAACHARVPIVSYTYLGKASATRLEPSCWTGPITTDVITNDGISLLERMDGTSFVKKDGEDLPYLFLVNGRRDGSIPWENNPPFYQALRDAHRGFAAYWDNQDHASSGKNAPEDVQAWIQRFSTFRRDQSYIAFSNTSTDRDPGNGSPENGDLVGWINRGMDWKDIEDTPRSYSITITANYPGIKYPVQTTLTLRRVQQFTTTPAAKLRVIIDNGELTSITTHDSGRITIPQVVIPDTTGVRVTIERD